MHSLILAVALWLFAQSGSTTRPCTYGVAWWPSRSASADFFVARATGDSVFVRDLYRGRNGYFTTPRSPQDPKIPVYGQVAEVIQAAFDVSPEPKPVKKIVLTWWEYGAGCEIHPPGRAIQITPGKNVFVNMTPLPRPSWIDGMKSYDVEGQMVGTSSLYAPELVDNKIQLEQDTLRPPAMTAEEFLKMYRAMATGGTSTQTEMKQFILWATENPALARKYPACAMVEIAEMNLLPRQARREYRLCR